MLSEYEIELITGLVEGDLEDPAEARALIERSETAKAEYEAQKVAYQALRNAEPVLMSDTERASLHRDIWTALRQDPQPVAKKAPWYSRLAPVAAVLFVMVGLAAVLSQGVLSQQAGHEATAESFAETSRGLSADTTAADSGDDDSADTTEATGGVGDDGAAADMADEEAVPMAPALEEVFTQVAEAVRVRADMEDVAGFRSFDDQGQLDEASECLERAGLPDHSIVGEFEDPTDGDTSTTYLVVVQTATDIGPDTLVSFVDTGTCRVSHVEG